MIGSAALTALASEMLRANARALTVKVERNEQGILLLLCIVTSSGAQRRSMQGNYIRFRMRLWYRPTDARAGRPPMLRSFHV
ncbi:hypothetical protein PFAS1_28800 (plasmid) [Pseudomonas frederiksbergensis]|nr:hypothetical protein PFAS1_28800 [Pseudomonas frederiksbergensis]OPK08880.1 hypothetical protein BZ163_19445 [Pseudomonas sp. VI4.1]